MPVGVRRSDFIRVSLAEDVEGNQGERLSGTGLEISDAFASDPDKVPDRLLVHGQIIQVANNLLPAVCTHPNGRDPHRTWIRFLPDGLTFHYVENKK